jgi:hypothetical protein
MYLLPRFFGDSSAGVIALECDLQPDTVAFIWSHRSRHAAQGSVPWVDPMGQVCPLQPCASRTSVTGPYAVQHQRCPFEFGMSAARYCSAEWPEWSWGDTWSTPCSWRASLRRSSDVISSPVLDVGGDTARYDMCFASSDSTSEAWIHLEGT